MKKTLFALTLAVTISSISACSTYSRLAMTNDGLVREDYGTRTKGTQVEDTTIEAKARINIERSSEALALSNIHIKSYNGVVLITGQVTDKALIEQVSAIVEKIRHVRRVHNELEVIDPTTVSGFNDSYLASKINSRLYFTGNIDSSRVEIVVENAKVYLLGMVTQQEADRIVKAVQQVSGLQKIVKVFEYISSDLPSA